jgi:hypothetical protein
MWLIVLVLVILCLVGVPAGPHFGYGYYPSSVIGLMVIILIIFLLLHR